MSFSAKEQEILLAQTNSKTIAEWVEYFDNKYSYKQIYGFFYNRKIPIKKLTDEELSKKQSACSRRYHIEEDFFKVWSRDMAYIFGFWCADGCIYGGGESTHRYGFDITVHKKDKYILKKMAEKLKYEGSVLDYVDRQACRLNFNCRTIYNDLIALGGQEAKSLVLKFPEVPNEFLSDFIRGYFDGDGCIYEGKNHRIITSFCCGSKDFLMSLFDKIKENVDIEGGFFDDSSKTLRFGKRDSIKLGRFMYRDDSEMFLLRKKEKFISYL